MQKPKRRFSRAAALVACLLVALPAAAASLASGSVKTMSSTSFPPFVLPEPTGPYRIGVHDFEVVDPGRAETFRPDLGEHRRIMVRVWYPAVPAAGAAPRPYRSPVEALIMGRNLAESLGLPDPTFEQIGAGPTHAVSNAPVERAGGSYPVVIFSHGYLGTVDTNTALMEELASHGVVVFSITHPFESAAVVYPQGDAVVLDASVKAYMGGRTLDPDTDIILHSKVMGDRFEATRRLYSQSTRLSQSAPIWRSDFISVLDAIEAGLVDREVRPIAALADLHRLIFAGMSFGGPAAVGACQADRRCLGAINLDGREVSLDLFDRPVRAPTLMVYSGNTFNLSGLGYNDFFYEPARQIGSRPEVRRMVVPDAGHWDFTDYTLLPKGDPSMPLLPASLRGPIEGRRMIRLVNDLFLDFIGRYAGSGQDLVAAKPIDDAVKVQDVSAIARWAASADQTNPQRKR